MAGRRVKVTVNLPVSTVEILDYLVEKGYFISRSDIIREGISIVIAKYSGVIGWRES